MEILLDTHIFLWWLLDGGSLSEHARNLISDGKNKLYWSAASSWEVSIKYSIGKLNLPERPEIFFPYHFLRNQIQPLSIVDTHSFKAGNLPMHHKDPFDRMLIAQAIVEEINLLSDDPLIKLYDVPLI